MVDTHLGRGRTRKLACGTNTVLLIINQHSKFHHGRDPSPRRWAPDRNVPHSRAGCGGVQVVRLRSRSGPIGSWLKIKETMQGLALVDYDNVCPGNRTARDVEIQTEGLLNLLARASRASFPGLRELDVRLYGGWIDECGIHSQSAQWLLTLLPVLRGRRQGLIVRPTLATTMLQFPNIKLLGTVRLRSKPKRQKMVDAMLGCDAVYAAMCGQLRVGIVSDDEDLLPAALTGPCGSPEGHSADTVPASRNGAQRSRTERLRNSRTMPRQEVLMTDEYFAYWNDRIRQDLASFADPGTTVDVDGSIRKFSASWTMRNRHREASFSVSVDQGPTCQDEHYIPRTVSKLHLGPQHG